MSYPCERGILGPIGVVPVGYFADEVHMEEEEVQVEVQVEAEKIGETHGEEQGEG